MLELGLDLPPRGSRDLRRALHRQLKAAILDGRLAPGSQLLASRNLAQRLGLSRNTVIAVYDLLLSEGYINTRPGAGVFVALAAPRGPMEARTSGTGRAANLNANWADAYRFEPMSTPVGVYDFRLGVPDTSSFPLDVWARLSNRALRQFFRAPSGDREVTGVRSLREAIAGHVSFTRAVACDPDSIVVTTGAQQAFDILARVLVSKERPVVAVEDPGYPPLRAAFKAAGGDIRPVPVDGEGVVVEQIPENVAVICVTPSHQFPLGVPMSPQRRKALLALAAERNAVVVEDDYDSEFRFSGRPLDALQTLDRQERVFYVGTFSKSLFPALRMGFVVAPEWAKAAIVCARQMSDGYGPTLTQETLAAFIAEGHLARHVRRMRKIYAERRTRLIGALALYCSDSLEPLPAVAGLHVSARIRRQIDGAVLTQRARDLGVVVESLDKYAVGNPRTNGLGFGYGLIATDRIEEGVDRIARILG